MKTNSKIVRDKVKKHILESVMNEYGEPFESLKDACSYVYSEFIRVANYPYNLIRIPNHQERFSDYLCGLPFNFWFYYYDIKGFLNELGINPSGKEYEDSESEKRYHYLIYNEILKNK